MLSGARSKARLLPWRGALAALGRDGGSGLTAAATTDWRQGGGDDAAPSCWAARLHTSAPRRNQEEAAASTVVEVAGSGLHFTPDASAAGGALVGLAGKVLVKSLAGRGACR